MKSRDLKNSPAKEITNLISFASRLTDKVGRGTKEQTMNNYPPDYVEPDERDWEKIEAKDDQKANEYADEHKTI